MIILCFPHLQFLPGNASGWLTLKQATVIPPSSLTDSYNSLYQRQRADAIAREWGERKGLAKDGLHPRILQVPFNTAPLCRTRCIYTGCRCVGDQVRSPELESDTVGMLFVPV